MIESPIADPVAPEIAETRRQRRTCVFVLAGSLFAVDLRFAREVAVFDSLTIVPRAPACLLGVANLRGIVMPVADVRPLLGLPAHEARTGLTALVVEDTPAKVAIAIDEALGLEWLDDVGEPHALPGLIQGRHLRGDQPVRLLDVARTLTALKLEIGASRWRPEEGRG